MKSIKFLALTLFMGASLHAQVFISQPLGGNTGDDGNTGQSFTPAVHTSGSFVDAHAYLTQFTFVVSPGSALPSTPAFLDIFSGGLVIGLVDASINTQNWAALGAGATATFNFSGNVALDVNSTYFAVFSDSPTALVEGGVRAGRGIVFASGDPYAGGELFHDNSATGSLDAEYTATFATAPSIPEPSTFAALLGLTVLGVALMRRYGPVT